LTNQHISMLKFSVPYSIGNGSIVRAKGLLGLAVFKAPVTARLQSHNYLSYSQLSGVYPRKNFCDKAVAKRVSLNAKVFISQQAFGCI